MTSAATDPVTQPLAESNATRKLTRRAQAVMPGKQSNIRRGVNVGFPEIFFESATGLRYRDIEEREYLDLALGIGPAIWGHSNPELIAAIRAQLERLPVVCPSLGRTEQEVALAEKIVEHVPCAEWVRFGMTGTEANQAVIRLARAYTGRPLFVSFENAFHGSIDNVFGGSFDPAAGDPPHAVATERDTEGLGPFALRESLKLRWNDAEGLERALGRYGDRIALVTLEPILCNFGACAPAPGFLETVRELCTRYGVVLAFDEVITGFRLGLGGAQAALGVTPDIAVFGKALSAGMPLSAIAGRRDVLELLRRDRVLVGGTFNSFPLGIAAALTNLLLLERDGAAYYRQVDERQQQLRAGMTAIAAQHGRKLMLQGPRGLMFMAFSARECISNPNEIGPLFTTELNRLRQLLADEGVLIAPGSRIFVSGALRSDDVAWALAAFERSLARLDQEQQTQSAQVSR